MNRTYAVTGCASGIGGATASLLRERGHRVIGIDRNRGGGVDVIADLSTPQGRAEAAAGVRERTAFLHGVVTAAGMAGLSNIDPALLVSVNYFGAIDLVTALKPLLLQGSSEPESSGHGSSVVLVSSTGITASPGWPGHLADTMLAGDEEKARAAAARTSPVSVYPATKAALAWWARTVGVKWAREGIRVNAVAPGVVDTQMMVETAADPVFGRFADVYPNAIGRRGRPEEVAEVIVFLLSDASRLMVGTTVFADGGTDAIRNKRRPRGPGTNRVTATVADLAIRGSSKVFSLRARS